VRVDRDKILAEFAARSLMPAERLAIFMVGSAVLGWANRGSDHDFCVIVRSPWRRVGAVRTLVPLQPQQVTGEAFQVDGRRWEVKYWLDGQVDQMLRKVSWRRFEAGASSTLPFVESEESFLERLFTCVPIEGDEWVRRRRADLRSTAFQAFLVTRSLTLADDCVEDALGQVGDGDLESAVLSARKAFGHAVDALLESRGHYGSQISKWRARRVKAARLPALSFERYWEVEAMTGFCAADPRPWIDKVVTFCKQLSIEVEI
jgi:hypothetical protein